MTPIYIYIIIHIIIKMIQKNQIPQPSAPSAQSPNPQVSQTGVQSVQSSQSVQQVQQVQLSAQLFLFQQIVIDMLNYCKRTIKSSPFDQMQVDKLVNNNKTQSIDIYQQYFLLGIGHPKTRQHICNKYEQLVKDNLINKNNLPPQMVTGIVTARVQGGGGSTASSGSNSVVGSSSNIGMERSVHIGKLIATILENTIQPASEIAAGLGYLLQGTRNKVNGTAFAQLIEKVYNQMSKYRKKPVQRFLSYYLNRIVNQVQYHESQYKQYQQKHLQKPKKLPSIPSIPSLPSIPSSQQQSPNPNPVPPPAPPPVFAYPSSPLCIHPGQHKYGKCFICDNGASNYDKDILVPLCSMRCKQVLRRVNVQCAMDDYFDIVAWLLDVMEGPSAGFGDQIAYGLLLREISQAQINPNYIGKILDIIVNHFCIQAVGIISIQNQQANVPASGNKIIQNSALILSLLIRKYPSIMLSQNKQPAQQQNIMKQPHSHSQFHSQSQMGIKNQPTKPCFNSTKILISQLVRLLQVLPIANNPLQLTLLKSLIQILSTKQHEKSSNSYKNLVLRELYLRCDCRVLQQNLVEKIFNVVSQYALQVGPSGRDSSSTISSAQSLGTNSTLGDSSYNSVSSNNLGVINNISLSGANCTETAIIGLQQLLASLVQTMEYYDQIEDSSIQIRDVIQQKKVKRYLQTKFVQQFNKKPTKSVQKLKSLFNNKISNKQIAIMLRQYMEYETKVKKVRECINKQETGTFFGTALKDKNSGKEDVSKMVFIQYLKLLEVEYQGREIDDCLRITFNSFSMPKQGQQVEVVFGPLSLALEPFMNIKVGGEATATYQLIMVAIMVQTSNNPSVKQSQKLKYEGYKKLCHDIDENLTEQRISNIYNRIKKRPLQVFMQYRGPQVFTKKYLKSQDLKTQFWRYLQDQSILQEKSQSSIKQKQSTNLNNSSMTITNKDSLSKKQGEKKQTVMSQPSQQEQSQIMRQGIQSKNSIQLSESRLIQNPQQKKKESFLSFTLLNLWQFIYMTIVNKHNLRGLEQSCILYGYSQLYKQFQAFFNQLYKLHVDLSQKSSPSLQSISSQSKLILLKLSIDNSNYVIGRQCWLIIIKLIFKQDSEEESKSKNSKKYENSYNFYQYETSDKLFTRTNGFNRNRLKQFLQAMCQFSSSDVKNDIKYTRQMYILHHITQIIQYNLSRLQQQSTQPLWPMLWPTIRTYFRNICIHPRKQIAMSAIDSYKQLTIKLLKLKLKPSIPFILDHRQLISVYLYVFERSPSHIKDLIINILLNVVCREMNSGWNQIYTILEIADSEDRGVVMKVVNRIVGDVGLATVGNLVRLHNIVIKELRIASPEMYAGVIAAICYICQYLNRLDILIQTMSKVKDIYKSTTNVTILSFFYRICNQCIKMADNIGRQALQRQEEIKQNPKEKQEQEYKQNLQSVMREQNKSNPIQQQQQKLYQMQSQLQKKFMKQAMEEEDLRKDKSSEFRPEQVHRLVYFQVFSVQMHILQIRSNKNFADSIAIFKELSPDVFFRNLGNNGGYSTNNTGEDTKTGFLTLWEMFLTSNQATNFCYFLHDYFGLIFNQISKIQQKLSNNNNDNSQQSSSLLKQQFQCSYSSIKSFQQLALIKRQILLWLIRLFMQSSKDEVMQLCSQDQDLNKTFSQTLRNIHLIGSNPNKIQLIQFYQSSKEYQSRSIQHLVLIKIIRVGYETGVIKSNPLISISNGMDEEKTNDIHSRILENLVESYRIASSVNEKPLLRNFLWNNQFFKGHDYLPGLMKQQIRSLQIIVKYFNITDMGGKIYKIMVQFIQKFIQKSSQVAQKYRKPVVRQKKQAQQNQKPQYQIIRPEQVQMSQHIQHLTQILYQDLGLWITNCEQILVIVLKKLSKQVENMGKQSSSNGDQDKMENKVDSKVKQIINLKQLMNICIQLSRVVTSKQVLKESSHFMQQLIGKIY